MNTNSVVLAPVVFLATRSLPGLPVCGDFRIHGRCGKAKNSGIAVR